MIVAIIVAAGRSTRMGQDKMFLKLGDVPLVIHTLLKFQDCQAVKRIFPVIGAGARQDFQRLLLDHRIPKVQHVVIGGQERQDSVWNGLCALPASTEIVLIHDGARPCVPEVLLDQTIASARKFGSGVAACKVMDTIKEVDAEGRVQATVPRDKLWAAQTPQTFRYDLIMRAYREARARNAKLTDEASAVELLGEPVHIVESLPTNLKVTTPADVEIAKVLLPAKVVLDKGIVPPGTFYFGKAIEERYR